MRQPLMLVAAMLLAACSTREYVFTPPDTPEGKACVAKCQVNETACRRDQDLRADRARAQCAAEAERRESSCEVKAPIEYAACLKFAKNDEERAACTLQDCTQPACYANPDYGLCGSDYRVCFQSCGGKIGIVEH